MSGEGKVVFKPAAVPLEDLETETVFHDEIESVFLCDGLGLTQKEAGGMMGVSRGTVQRLVNAGRRKIIDSVIAGKALVIRQAKEEQVDEGL